MKNKFSRKLLVCALFASSPLYAAEVTNATAGIFDLNETTTTSQDSCDDVGKQIAVVMGQRIKANLPSSSTDNVQTAIANSKAVDVNLDKSSVDVSLTSLWDNGLDLGKWMSFIKDKATSIMTSMWERVKTMFYNTYRGALVAVQNRLNETYMNQVQRIAKNLGKYGGTAFTESMSGLVPSIVNVADACEKAAANGSLSACANEAYKNLSTQVSNNAQQAMTNISENAVNAAANAVNSGVSQINTTINGTINNATDKAVDAVNQVLGGN